MDRVKIRTELVQWFGPEHNWSLRVRRVVEEAADVLAGTELGSRPGSPGNAIKDMFATRLVRDLRGGEDLDYLASVLQAGLHSEVLPGSLRQSRHYQNKTAGTFGQAFDELGFELETVSLFASIKAAIRAWRDGESFLGAFRTVAGRDLLDAFDTLNRRLRREAEFVEETPSAPDLVDGSTPVAYSALDALSAILTRHPGHTARDLLERLGTGRLGARAGLRSFLLRHLDPLHHRDTSGGASDRTTSSAVTATSAKSAVALQRSALLRRMDPAAGSRGSTTEPDATDVCWPSHNAGRV